MAIVDRSDGRQLCRLARTPPVFVLLTLAVAINAIAFGPNLLSAGNPERWRAELNPPVTIGPPRWGTSTMFGQRNIVAPSSGERVFGGVPIFLARDASGLRFLGSVSDPEASSERWRVEQPPPGTVLAVNSQMMSCSRGWWADTQEYEAASLSIAALDRLPVSVAESNAARAILVAKLRTMGPHYQSWADTLQAGGVRRVGTLREGYLYNALSVALGLVWLYSLSGVPGWWTWFGRLAWVRIRRCQRGRCGWCGYPWDDRGHDAPCPECGQRPIDDFVIREQLW